MSHKFIDEHTLFVNRNGLEIKFDYDPFHGMMFRRQLPEYMQYLAPKGVSIWRNSDKKILLIGGGQSKVRQWFRKIGMNCEITNVDFYTDYKPAVSHVHIKEDFFDWNIPVDFYDQAWALWSLPSYALSKTEIMSFFIKGVLGLAPKGVLRVFPINRGPGDAGLLTIEYSNEQRKQDSIAILNQIKKLGFNVEFYSPQDTISIIDTIRNSKREQDKKIYDLFLKQVSQRRQRYIKQEFENYQTKPLNKIAIGVNIYAPANKSIKADANVKLINMLGCLSK